jgi:hypothetical protein
MSLPIFQAMSKTLVFACNPSVFLVDDKEIVPDYDRIRPFKLSITAESKEFVIFTLTLKDDVPVERVWYPGTSHELKVPLQTMSRDLAKADLKIAVKWFYHGGSLAEALECTNVTGESNLALKMAVSQRLPPHIEWIAPGSISLLVEHLIDEGITYKKDGSCRCEGYVGGCACSRKQSAELTIKSMDCYKEYTYGCLVYQILHCWNARGSYMPFDHLCEETFHPKIIESVKCIECGGPH